MKKFRGLRVREKLLLIYFAVLFVPFIIIAIYISSSIKDTMFENNKKDIELIGTKASFEVKELFNEIIDISNFFMTDEELINLVRTKYENPYEMYIAYQENPIFLDYIRHYNKLQDNKLFVTNESMYTNSKVIINHEKVLQANWYLEAIDHPNQLFWKTIEDPITNKSHITLIKNLVIDEYDVGVLALYINAGYLESIFDNSNMNYLLTIDNELVYSKLNNQTEENIPNFVEDSQKKMSVTHGLELSTSSINNIKLITFMPENIVSQQIQLTLYKGYFVIFIAFGISFLLIEQFIKTFNQRILILQSSMANVAKEQFNIPKKIKGNDELSKTYDFLYLTMLSLDKLIQEKYVHQIQEQDWQIKHQESEFKRLSSQINPHFLYNSLEQIRMQALMQNNKDVANSVKILSKLLQKSLRQEKKIVKLKDEIEFITLYLKMQKLRFGDRFTYDVVVDEKVMHEQIISMIIQPIVENSFVHGIEAKSGPGHIDLIINIDEDKLYILIIDNGLGMSQERLDDVLLLMDVPSDKHIGLSNIKQRMKLYYGDDITLNIQSKENVGTKVEICIPRIGSENNEPKI